MQIESLLKAIEKDIVSKVEENSYLVTQKYNSVEPGMTVEGIKQVVSEVVSEYLLKSDITKENTLTCDETEEIRTISNEMNKLFDYAYAMNQTGAGSNLSRMVTTYLPNIQQSYNYFVEKSKEEKGYEADERDL